ncbi:hypothetical protein [Bacteroides acidifaciens]|uniref:hypothetical protein n=1 Tax=Bacteroides acidifaciens TaxID=85831 RepID=UPI0027148B11|nr:hypothetical protein [Bacteroides acidifaciens]
MTFEEFKALALNPPYIDSPCVYRVDMHRYVKRFKDAKDVREFEVRLCQSFMYTDWQRVQKMISQFIYHERYNEHLYALYIYQLPLNCDVSRDQYRQLWVYDRKGNLNARSMCSALIEDLSHQSAKFRGHDSATNQFKPGDVVEIYDREKEQVRLGVVVKRPPTIEQCWEMRKEVEKACIVEGIGVENTDDNYWLYATDDCYCVAFGPDCELSYPHPTDVFAPMYPITDNLCMHFDECYHFTLEKNNDEISDNKITEETTIARLKDIQRLIELY